MAPPKGSTKARKPTKLKLVDSTFDGSRANPNEPETKPEIPSPPDYLSGHQKGCWAEIAERLKDYKVTSAIDFMAFEAMVCALSKVRMLEQQLRDQETGDEPGLTYETVTESGSEMRRPKPEMQLLKDWNGILKDWLGRFGLTPADRGRVSAKKDGAKKNPEDEFAS